MAQWQALVTSLVVIAIAWLQLSHLARSQSLGHIKTSCVKTKLVLPLNPIFSLVYCMEVDFQACGIKCAVGRYAFSIMAKHVPPIQAGI